MIQRFEVGDEVIFMGLRGTIEEVVRRPTEGWRYQIYRLSVDGRTLVAIDTELTSVERPRS